jgi:predicted transcriptional regulator
MGKHRTRLKILEDILSVINDNHGVNKTQIMYKAYLSYRLLVRYLTDIMDAGLVICDNDNYYKLTQKGETFLARFSEYSKSCEVVKEKLSHIEDQRVTLEEMCSSTEIVNVNRASLERENKA